MIPSFRAVLPFVCLMLAACNARSAAPPSPAAMSAAPPIVMAAGGDCSAVIQRYRAVAKSDADTGNANASVYAQIDREISGAESSCAAGREQDALRAVAASKSRHGYPSGN